MEKNFKKGDRFTPHKPKDVNEYPLWQPCMDLLNGKTLVIENITSNGEISAECCLFHPDWCEKVEENQSVETNEMVESSERAPEVGKTITPEHLRISLALAGIYTDERCADLPKSARFAIARCIQPFSGVYTSLREKYGVLEAEERLCWCLFGSLDGSTDIDVLRGKASIEISSHCSACQYEKPFCNRVLEGLTSRQQECIMLMRSGLTDKEVARELGISYLTVIKHINNAVERFRDMTGKPITRQYIISQLNIAGL